MTKAAAEHLLRKIKKPTWVANQIKKILTDHQGFTFRIYFNNKCWDISMDKNGKINGVAQYEFNQLFPKEGWVEHDAEEIWNTQLKAIVRSVMHRLHPVPNQIDRSGIARIHSVISSVG